MSLTLAEKVELIELHEKRAWYESGRLFYRWFQDKEGYNTHLKFMSAGADFNQRVFLAGNRTGKSMTGAFEVTCHATGVYPDWWVGKRFDHATSGWVVATTSQKMRDTVQVALMGEPGGWGTGMLPRDLIITPVPQASAPRVDIVQVKHVSGGVSIIGFKTNDAGRVSFEGTAKDYVWVDEECDEGVWSECLTRTLTTQGVIFTTFTPMKGLTPLIMNLFEEGVWTKPKPWVGAFNIDMWSVPHISKKEVDDYVAQLQPYEREARSKGIPVLGAGRVYPEDPAGYTIKAFELPKHYLRIGGMDVGWKKTAACWGAIDPETGIVYIYDEHYKGEAEPFVHTEIIKLRNKNGVIPLEIDSAAHGRSQLDGQNLFHMYEELGLKLNNANKAVYAGIFEVWTLLSQGRLKIFSNCTNLLSELSTYHRNEKGEIVKANDHLCDCLRYLVMGRDHAVTLAPRQRADFTTVSNQYRRSTF